MGKRIKRAEAVTSSLDSLGNRKLSRRQLIRATMIASAAAAVLPIIGSARADDAASPAKPGGFTPATYTQAKPYTDGFFGAWGADMAKVHLMEITCEAADVGWNVRVQVDHHPMNAEQPHYIMWIAITDGEGNILGLKEFVATDPAPAVATFNLPSAPKKIRAFERCNIHGIWMSEKNV